MSIAQKIKSNPQLKKFVHRMLIPKGEARPRLWVKLFLNRFFHFKGKGAKVCRRTRMDLLPFNNFHLGNYSKIEDFCTVNNGVGDVFIGDYTLIGIGNVIIGPAHIGNNVILAQNIVISGLNHEYKDPEVPIHLQPINTAPISIGDDCWIAANAVITAGVSIGKHCVIAAGAVVTKNIPDYCVAVGNPAKAIKQYDSTKKEWVRL